jgi:hypothetical protein
MKVPVRNLTVLISSLFWRIVLQHESCHIVCHVRSCFATRVCTKVYFLFHEIKIYFARFRNNFRNFATKCAKFRWQRFWKFLGTNFATFFCFTFKKWMSVSICFECYPEIVLRVDLFSQGTYCSIFVLWPGSGSRSKSSDTLKLR